MQAFFMTFASYKSIENDALVDNNFLDPKPRNQRPENVQIRRTRDLAT